LVLDFVESLDFQWKCLNCFFFSKETILFDIGSSEECNSHIYSGFSNTEG